MDTTSRSMKAARKVDNRIMETTRKVDEVQDKDGSSIKRSSKKSFPHAQAFIVSTPGDMGLLKVLLVDAEHAAHAVKWLVKGIDKEGEKVMGLDSESVRNKVVMVQVSVRRRCVVIRMKEGCDVRGGELAEVMMDESILKAGAELYGDALDLLLDHKLVVNGLMNLTPYYQTTFKLGLRGMFEKEYGCEWVKDKEITCSDWSVPQLSLKQVKYAALDAWVSFMVGTKIKSSINPINPINLSTWVPNLLERIAIVSRHTQVMEDLQKKNFKVSGAFELQKDGTIAVFQDRFSLRVRLGNEVHFTTEKGQEVVGKVVSVHGKRAILRILQQITTVPAEIYASNHNEKDLCLDAQNETICKLLTSGTIRSTLLKQLFISSPSELFTTSYNHALVLSLNGSQRAAVDTAIKNPISAIIGPPGTGKTSTIACIAQCLTTKPNKGGVVVIAARQNVAALNVLHALIKRGVKGCLLYVSEDYYVEWHEDDYKEVKEKYVIVGSGPGADPLRTWQKLNPGFNHPAVVVCSTGCLTVSKGLVGVLPRGFSTLLLDECSQMWIGEIVPILERKADDLKRLVLVGDHKQLPPFGSTQIKDAQLDSRSLFEYCLEKRFASQLLNEQYRMPPSIGKFISKSFYNGKITTRHSSPLPPCAKKLTSQRVLWVDTNGHQQFGANGSSYNTQEVSQAVHLVEYFTKHLKEPQRVVVITPYEEQRTRIEVALKQIPRLKQMFNNQTIVYCIDSYQGREADIVIVSLVVSNPKGSLGFVKDKHRLNVMFSRAKLFMCVVGSYMTVAKSKRSEIFTPLWAIAGQTTFANILPILGASHCCALGALVVESPIVRSSSPRYLKKKATPAPATQGSPPCLANVRKNINTKKPSTSTTASASVVNSKVNMSPAKNAHKSSTKPMQQNAKHKPHNRRVTPQVAVPTCNSRDSENLCVIFNQLVFDGKPDKMLEIKKTKHGSSVHFTSQSK